MTAAVAIYGPQIGIEVYRVGFVASEKLPKPIVLWVYLSQTPKEKLTSWRLRFLAVSGEVGKVEPFPFFARFWAHEYTKKQAAIALKRRYEPIVAKEQVGGQLSKLAENVGTEELSVILISWMSTCAGSTIAWFKLATK